MADGYRFPQQAAGNYYYPQHTQQAHHPRHLLRTGTPPNNIRSVYNNDTPSPSRSPDSQSPAQNVYGMFNPAHQAGQQGRVNGTAGRGAMPMMYNYQHHQTHQPQHTQHHANLQDHNAHNTNGNVLGHHTSYSSGVLSNATPSFTPSGLPNGHSSTTRGGQAQQINEHWAEQLKQRKEAEKAHQAMVLAPSGERSGHHYARMKAGENRGISSAVTTTSSVVQESENVNRNRPSNTDTGVKRQDWHNMDLSGQGIRVLSAPLFNYNFLNELYLASNRIKYLPEAIGQLRQLRHLDASYNQLTELPPELGMCVYLKNLLLFENSITNLPHELGSLYHLEMLGIEGNPLHEDLKNEIMERGTKSLVLHLREEATVPLPPNSRVILDLMDGAPIPANQERFKVFSYNILCDTYVNPVNYGYVPSVALSWDYRKEQILQEIQTHDPDFVCLQEVDDLNYQEFFRMKLAYNDYKGHFGQKSRARTMTDKDQKAAVDGCATFHKASKYILLDKAVIDFANLAINRGDMKNQADIFNRVMPRDHIAIVSFYENRLTGTRVIVANAHVFWDPEYSDVKLIQMAILMDWISKKSEEWTKWPAVKDKKTYKIADEADPDIPVEALPEPAPSMEYTNKTQLPLIVCGDLNSKADSSVFELLATGHVGVDHEDLLGHQYGDFTRYGIDHPFSLRSAYTNVHGTPDELTFTNYTPAFVGHIDHIWYSTNTLENTALLGPVDAEYLKRVPGLPHYHFPSDHIALLAEFSLKGRKEKKTLPEPDFGSSSRRRD